MIKLEERFENYYKKLEEENLTKTKELKPYVVEYNGKEIASFDTPFEAREYTHKKIFSDNYGPHKGYQWYKRNTDKILGEDFMSDIMNIFNSIQSNYAPIYDRACQKYTEAGVTEDRLIDIAQNEFNLSGMELEMFKNFVTPPVEGYDIEPGEEWNYKKLFYPEYLQESMSNSIPTWILNHPTMEDAEDYTLENGLVLDLICEDILPIVYDTLEDDYDINEDVEGDSRGFGNDLFYKEGINDPVKIDFDDLYAESWKICCNSESLWDAAEAIAKWIADKF